MTFSLSSKLSSVKAELSQHLLLNLIVNIYNKLIRF